MTNRYTLFSILSILPLCGLLAQVLEVQNEAPITPINLITNTFLGDGVEVLDVTYNGALNSVALFKNGSSFVGLERGIVITTGEAVSDGSNTSVTSPVNSLSSGNISDFDSDPDLEIIANGANINDVVSYTITFRPAADLLEFRYVFASEEYPEFVCSNFNDIFGFFISGPGISGPFSNNSKNIALIPGTDLPVRINNVNPGVNGGSQSNIDNCMPPLGSLDYSEFYIDNSGNSAPVFDGMTKVFTAEAEVIPCEVYTIKIIICDIGDAAYDSGVFLEAKSFGSPGLFIDPVGLALDGSISEGCGNIDLQLMLPGPAEADYGIDYVIRGTATNGVDYTPIPDTLWIPIGDSIVHLNLEIFEDNIDDDEETIIIDYQKDLCTRDTIEIILRDNRLYVPDLPDSTIVCRSESFSLDATLDVPIPDPPSFSSTSILDLPGTSVNELRYSDIEVSNVIPLELREGVIKSVCIDSLRHRWIDDLDIYLVSPSGRFLELTTDNGGAGGNLNGNDYYINTCFTPNATVPITPPGTQAPGSAVPFTGEWLPEGVFSDLWDAPNLSTNGTWRLLVIDDSFGLGGELYSWSICFEPFYEITYNWTPAAGLSCTDCPNPTFSPDVSTSYFLTIEDTYGCQVLDTVHVEVAERPESPQLSCYVIDSTSVSVSWVPDPNVDGYEISTDGVNFTDVSDVTVFGLDNLLPSQDITFYLTSITDCITRDTLVCGTLDCSPPSINVINQSASCLDANNGRITINVLAGIPPLTYELGDQMNGTGQFSGLTPGTYLLRVTEATGCAYTEEIIIEADAELMGSIEIVSPISCNGSDDAVLRVDVPNGEEPLTILWSNNESTAQTSNWGAGLASVTVTDAAGCTNTFSITLEDHPPLEANFAVLENIECFGEASGHIATSVAGGQAPYTYLWSNGMNTPEIRDLAAGDYGLTLTDAMGCTAELFVTLDQPEELTAEVTIQEITCFGDDDGMITIEAAGGTPNYQFRVNGEDFGTRNTFLGLEPDSYILQVEDAKGCLFFAGEYLLNEPAEITVDLGGQRIDIPFGTAAELEPVITSDRPIVSYEWSPADSTFVDCTTCPTASYFPESQLSVHLRVMDEFGCTGEDIVTINVTKNFPVMVPTGFSPNGDQMNDILRVHGVPGIRVAHFRVYNRWGELVFERSDFMVNDETQGWDGEFRDEPLNGGIYIWQVDAEMPDGRREQFQGETTLIR